MAWPLVLTVDTITSPAIVQSTTTLGTQIASVMDATTTLGSQVASVTQATATLGSQVMSVVQATTTLGSQIANIVQATTTIAAQLTNYKMVQATQTISVIAQTAITGLTATLAANSTYYFEALIVFQTAALTTGARFSANGPATPRIFTLQTMTPISLVATTMGMNRAYDTGTASASVDVINANMIAKIFGVIATRAAGTLQITGASEVASSNLVIAPGSFLVCKGFQ